MATAAWSISSISSRLGHGRRSMNSLMLRRMAMMTATPESGGLEPTATYVASSSEISHAMADYPLKPKSRNEMIAYILQPSDIAPGSGSVTPYGYVLWIGNGVCSRAGWFGGPAKTTPWSSTPSLADRGAQTGIKIDDDGYLYIPVGTWGFIGSGQTIKIYEWPYVPS